MKRIFLLIGVLLSIIEMQGQYLQVHKTDGIIITVPLNVIDSITFAEGSLIGQGQPCPDVPSVTDIDGNVYNTIIIGEKCWMKENLKTTHYLNGIPIEYPGSDNTAWQNSTNGAYAWFDNSIEWKHYYGALYNWYAVVNPNGLCPEGWHVPSDIEWTQLVDYLAEQGFPNSNVFHGVGNALKSCRQISSLLGDECDTSEHPRWDIHLTHCGFDEFGFSGLPGGSRFSNGSYTNYTNSGVFWSSSEANPTNALNRTLSRNRGDLQVGNYSKSYGLSVRCLKD